MNTASLDRVRLIPCACAAQPNASSKQAQAQEGVSLIHLQLEASSTHALVQQRLLLPRTPCAAECLINAMRIRSNVRRCFVPHAQRKNTSIPCACAANASRFHSYEQLLPRLRINHYYASLSSSESDATFAEVSVSTTLINIT